VLVAQHYQVWHGIQGSAPVIREQNRDILVKQRRYASRRGKRMTGRGRVRLPLLFIARLLIYLAVWNHHLCTFIKASIGLHDTQADYLSW
jgi:hypothetical protein